MSHFTTIDGLPRIWQKQVRTLRDYGGETPAVAVGSSAVQLDEALHDNDETSLALTDATRESGYSADHLGCVVRQGETPNPGRPGVARIAGKPFTCKTGMAAPRLAPRLARPESRWADRAIRDRMRRLMMARTKRRRRMGQERRPDLPGPKDLIRIEWRDDGQEQGRSLRHRDWDRAKS